ncbi:hypothetical protein GCM10010873_12520 [Cypionkella aquatica]|uniref:Translocase n=1 Tax=Cypionkella aquatica TaxID=1756042 RepID=A0AA37TRZ1_9RHOB|nr:hypothetical protein [Cypionkella aquatica]GLS86278.1 hypothetical protein GCM10010873_12520 [Cypionkella aquatica]
MAVDMKRRLIRGGAVIAIALGAGQLVQGMSDKKPAPRVAEGQLSQKPTKLERVAATDVTAKPEAMLAKPATPKAAELPAPVAKAAPAPEAKPAPIEVAKADACPVTLELANSENALIAVTLISPCHANERVVLKHAGLTISAKTTLTGALFTDLPALEQDASVEVMFKDNTSVQASVAVPELASLRRFAVQWQQDDAFQLHGFEDASDFGGAGDVSAATPHQPAAGVPAKGGFLTVLGEVSTDLPMLAQVYTYPKDSKANAEIVIEAAVTDATCGRELLGQTLQTANGAVKITDMSLAMPECDAVGDYLVLKNLVPDMTIAAN